MGNAILYCVGCSMQLRETDFDRGAAFRADARAWCKACAPEEVRSQPPPADRKRMGETNPIKILPISSTRKISIVTAEEPPSSKPLIIIGVVVAGLALLVVAVL